MNCKETTVSLEQPNLSIMEVFLVFWLICISGNPLFSEYGGKYIYVGTAIGAMAISFYYGKPLYSTKLILFSLACLVLFLLQSAVLTGVSIQANVNFLARIYLGFLITLILGEKFRFAYMKVMFFVAAVSLVLWVVNRLIELPGFVAGRHRSLIIFNYIENGEMFGIVGRRNCGMFWEPGAYQGFIMLVPLMYIGQIRELLSQFRKECIVLILALLSTMSTTGYVVFALLSLLVIMKDIKNVFLKFFVAFSAITVFMWAYYSLDFLGEKIEEQYEDALVLETGEASWSRMGALQVDMDNIKRHPLVGNGFMKSEKYGLLSDDMDGAGNGFSGVLNMLGIPFMFLYFLQLFRNSPAATSYESAIIPLIVIIMLNGEYFMNYPLFWSLMFVKYPSIFNNNGIIDNIDQ